MSPESPVYKAVIFDLDGTLLDTIDDIAVAMNRVLEMRDLGSYPIEAYKALVGDGVEELVRRAFSSHPLTDEEIAGIVRDFRREYGLCWRDHSRPYSGVPELLEELARKGTKTAVLSNKSHPFTKIMTGELLAHHRFDVVRGAMPGVPLKPDPRPALMIASEMGVPPAAVVFLGDTNVDMLTAVAAGMLPVGALWGFRSAEELKAGGAAALLASPLEILPYFPVGGKRR
ncbi:MAG: HAD family hydrolase [Candidatus Aminicenantales bacterium]|jgi:phosphoglycolate phosphatase